MAFSKVHCSLAGLKFDCDRLGQAAEDTHHAPEQVSALTTPKAPMRSGIWLKNRKAKGPVGSGAEQWDNGLQTLLMA